MNAELKQLGLAILAEELIPAMGCTEPIALAYAAAVAREQLDGEPDTVLVRASGNIIKNVRCVQIPHSGGMHGIEAAVLLGAIGGDAARGMEVLTSVRSTDAKRVQQLLDAGVCTVTYLESDVPLHFIIEERCGADVATVEVRYAHMNVVRLTKNGVVVKEGSDGEQTVDTDRSALNLDKIKQFADEIDIDEVRELIDRQIRYNMDIAYEGISGDYGVGLGKIIRASYADSTVTRMKAYAAAASEARMDGCDMPVIINSGSGNQGIASSVPIIVYARENNMPREKLYRALVFAALLTVYQKEFIGKLSAFCGAVSASCAAGAAITYLCGGSMAQIRATIDNTLANIPGVICDGAKISCAAKIASCIDASMMAHFLAMAQKEYQAYTGILQEEVGETISCVGHIGKFGMKETDKEIVKLMLES